ncbi:MAG: spoIIGA [Bacillales bacterium]|jgi:stage II sporulation protein GA (sporulation sigma-E factor processing peptidase)|nr:spoIIGA [Bacillales bacterium]
MYIDVIWLLNLCFDTLLLIWTAAILKRKFHYWRAFAGGLFGSATVWLYITPFSYVIDIIPVKISISIVMIMIFLGIRQFKTVMTNLITFYLVTFLSGGLLYGLHNLFSINTSTVFENTTSTINLYGDPLSWSFVLVSFPFTFILLKYFSGNIRVIKFNQHHHAKASCQINDIQLELAGLIDTGNQLRDPISRLPVVIVSFEKMGQVLPDQIKDLVDREDVFNLNLDEKWQQKVRVVPYKVVGKSQNLLIAFKPDRFIIQDQEKDCLISFTREKLFGHEDLNAIIHPDLAG